MANLLQKASIVLTPTAYDDGKVLCAKPSEAPYGDFDFSRNSAATRVNAQGLVENVQILSSNLVQNGDFSEEGSEEVSNGSFSQEGVQLVTNGSFDTDSDWIKGTGWSISGGKANFNGTSNSNLRQDNVTEENKIYKVSFEVSDYVSGIVQVNIGDNLQGEDFTFSSNGVFVFYTTADSGTTQMVRFRPTTSAEFSIDNVSVREVGQDWSLGTGWSIAEDKAISDGTTDNLDQNNILTIGNSYKAQFTVSDLTTGALSFRLGGTNEIININSNGTYTAYGVADGVILRLRSQSGFDGSITNISVKEVGQNWVLGTGYSIGEDKAVATNASNSNLQQTNITITNTKKYKINFKIDDYSSGTIKPQLGAVSAVVGTAVGANGTYTEILTANNNFDRIVFRTSGTAFNGSITNISVIEITDETNLPRINYEGFSYDGSGAIIPDSGCGSWLFEPQSTNAITYSELFSDASWNDIDVSLESGYLAPDGTNNAYKVTSTGTQSHLYTGGVGGAIGKHKSIYARTLSGTGTVNLCNHNSDTNALFTITEQWQRFDISHSGIDVFYAVDFRGAGATLSEVIIWGAQMEQQSYATSYIPTEGATVTRNQDVCNNGGSLASINSTEGTLYAEIAALANDGSFRVISINGGSRSNSVKFLYSAVDNSIRGVVRSSSSSVFDFNHILSDATDFIKVALSYKLNNFKMYVNGVEVATDTSGNTPIGLNQLAFTNDDGIFPFFGKTKALAVWKEALSDQELADLTYPTPTDPTFALDFDTIATDFTFARGSEATYVDAQGLIKSTNEIGPELVTNGDFNTDTDWTKGTGWSIGEDKANCDGTQTSNSDIAQGLTTQSGKSYKITYTISEYTSGSIFVRLNSGNTTTSQSSVGTFTGYLSGENGTQISLRANADFIGSIDNVSVKEVITATNTPRLDYSTGAEAFLLEPQSTNLFLQSEIFTSWNGYQATSNTTTSPSGNSVLFLDFEDVRMFPTTTISSSTEYTSSIYLKANKVADVKFRNAAGQDTVISLTTNWVRYELTATSNSTSTNALLIDARFSQGLGASGLEIALWGAQLEQQSYATSYIPTAGTTVTRNQESCINATPGINSEEGVLYVEINAENVYSNSRYIALSDGTTSNRVIIGVSLNVAGTITCFVSSGGSTVAILSSTADITDFNKIALRYSENNFSLFLNGVKASTDTSGLPPVELNRLTYGNGVSNAQPFYGSTKDIQVYTKALSDAELIKLTT